MKACSALFLSAALIVAAVFTIPSQDQSAQSALEKPMTAKELNWGDDVTLKVGDKYPIAAELKKSNSFVYSVTTKGESQVQLGEESVGASVSVLNQVQVEVMLSEIALTNPKPDEDKPLELALKYSRFSSRVEAGESNWSIFVDQANSVTKSYENGKEVPSFASHTGRPNPSTMRSHMSKNLAFVRVGEDNMLSNFAHAAIWKSAPKDMPANILDPLALVRFMVSGVSKQELEIVDIGGKPSALIELNGVMLPLEVASSTLAEYDLKLTLLSLSTAKPSDDAKEENDPTVDNADADKPSEEPEARLMRFAFEATPKAGQNIALDAGITVAPQKMTGTIAIDPRTGMVAEADIASGFKGDKASGKLSIRLSLRSQNIE